MDLFWIGFSVLTGDIMNAIKAKDGGSDSSKDSKDKQKDANKSSKDKHKDQKHSEKSGHNSSDEKSSGDPNTVLKTTPYDPRFPNQNQTRNCYQNYLDYQRCLTVKDESYCHYYQWAYRELCPKAWTDKWDDQRERGIFAGRI